MAGDTHFWLKTRVQANNLIENSADFLLSPLRTLFGGRHFSYYKGSFLENSKPLTSVQKIIKTALAILFFPIVPIGILLKSCTLLLPSVRNRLHSCLQYCQLEPFFLKDPNFQNKSLSVRRSEDELLRSEEELSEAYRQIEMDINRAQDEYLKHNQNKFYYIKALENLNKNRWDIFPYDYNCPEPYVNASLIALAGLKFIAMQGMKDTTVVDTFKLLLHENACTIVSLAMDQEEKRGVLINKCYKFWNGFTSNEDNFALTLKKEKPLFQKGNEGVIKRKLKLKLGSKTKTITQFHYQNWPDRSTPNPDCFQYLIDAVQKRMAKKPSTLATHCSAGIGRTGTFISSYALFNQQRAEKKLDKKFKVQSPAQTILNLRLQRKGSVQNEEQLQAVYEFNEYLQTR